MHRVLVAGISEAGKTTLCRHIAEVLGWTQDTRFAGPGHNMRSDESTPSD